MKQLFLLFTIAIWLMPAQGKAQDYKQIRDSLEYIHRTDQQYRKILDSLVRIEKREWNDPAIQAIIPAAAKLDSVNLGYITRLLDTHGWPGQQQVGKLANEAVFLVIQHAERDVLVKYFPLLAASYELGGTPAKYYAMMLDRLMTDEQKPQVFGTQIDMKLQDGKYQPFPIADRAGVDKRRAKLGLPTINSWIKELNGGK